MKTYYLVLRAKGGRFYAFYKEVGEPPAYDFDKAFGVGYTVKEALKEARKHKPDGEIAYTYLDNR